MPRRDDIRLKSSRENLPDNRRSAVDFAAKTGFVIDVSDIVWLETSDLEDFFLIWLKDFSLILELAAPPFVTALPPISAANSLSVKDSKDCSLSLS